MDCHLPSHLGQLDGMSMRSRPEVGKERNCAGLAIRGGDRNGRTKDQNVDSRGEFP